MSGYKRVNFYELCRLCATNQQKEKTHIFQEEGRKIQLQNKIQSCLSLTVCENDFLPKVVCSKCLRTLEVCYTFRQECVSSESMLSSYFKNFRYTEDFKKSGKVYIKDTATKCPVLPTSQYQQQHSEPSPTSQQIQQQQQQQTTTLTPPTTANIINTTSFATINDLKPLTPAAIDHHVPSFYTLQLPAAIVTNHHQHLENKSSMIKTETKIVQQSNTTSSSSSSTSHQTSYNLSAANLATIKTLTTTPTQQKHCTNTSSSGAGSSEAVSNVVVNANGEVLHIAQLVDFESIINQTNLQKKLNNSISTTVPLTNTKRKTSSKETDDQQPVIKIDLTNNDLDTNFDTNQNQKKNNSSAITTTNSNNNNNNNNNKFAAAYTIKVEDQKLNPSVIFNNNFSNLTSDFNQQPSTVNNFNTFNSNNTANNVYHSTSNLISTNLVTSTPLPPGSGLTSETPSTVNLNVLNHENFARNLNQNYVTGISSSGPMKDEQHQQINSTGTQPIKTHICEVCQKSFKRREHLYQHVKLHTGFRPYTCENCNKSFMRKEHLLRHMTSHSGQKNFTCNICDKSFSRNDNLLKHKKTHDKQASYACDVCQKQFVMKHYYLAHKLTHDGDRCIANVWNVLKT